MLTDEVRIQHDRKSYILAQLQRPAPAPGSGLDSRGHADGILCERLFSRRPASGTRFLPATKAQPKEMLPLVDKPIIQYGVEEAVRSGVHNIILVTGRGKNAIEDHFDVAIELETFLESRGKLRPAGPDSKDLQPHQFRVCQAGRAAWSGPCSSRDTRAGWQRAVRRHSGRRRDRRRPAGIAADD